MSITVSLKVLLKHREDVQEHHLLSTAPMYKWTVGGLIQMQIKAYNFTTSMFPENMFMSITFRANHIYVTRVLYLLVCFVIQRTSTC